MYLDNGAIVDNYYPTPYKAGLFFLFTQNFGK